MRSALAVHALAAVVVVEEQRPRIRLAREAERVGDVPVAQFLPEHGVPQRTPAVGDGFVDDVPRMNPAAVVPDDGADVTVRTAVRRSSAVSAFTHDGVAPCHRSVCPLRRIPCAAA